MLRKLSLRFVQRTTFKWKTNFYKGHILDLNLEVATGTLLVEVELDIVEFMISVSINPMLCCFLLHIMIALTYIVSFLILLWRGYKVLHFLSGVNRYK